MPSGFDTPHPAGLLVLALGLLVIAPAWIVLCRDGYRKHPVKGTLLLLAPLLLACCPPGAVYIYFYAMTEYTSGHKPLVLVSLTLGILLMLLGGGLAVFLP